jgi:hypothetical protein
VAGRNNPDKSTAITTGTYKEPETYQEQARRHENPGALPQKAKAPPSRDLRMGQTHKADSQERIQEPEPRSGSDSNARNPRKSPEVHESDETRRQPQPHPKGYDLEHDYQHDLEAAHRPAEDGGLGTPYVVGEGFSAYDFKELHRILVDFTDDELKRLEIVPTGTRLEQGSRYLDLIHRERGAFVALADMVAEPDHYYVAKKETDYILWNRLNLVTNPARLDESEIPGG